MENLTGTVRKSENYYFAFGGLADVWKGEWTQDTRHSTKATVVSAVQAPTSNSVTNKYHSPPQAGYQSDP